LVPLLKNKFQIHTLDFEGHGGSPEQNSPFGFDLFANNVLNYLAENSIHKADIFGYSMGGHVGLYLAKTSPQRVRRVFTLATKFLWTPETAAREAAFLDPDQILKKVHQFAKTLEERHSASGWRNVLEKTRTLFLEQGKKNILPMDDLKEIPHMVRVSVGDRDKTVSIEETVEVYRCLQRGEFQVFPGTPHPFEQVPLSNLAQSLIDFFGKETNTANGDE
jgi:pimeloyl-ACP methyl ester carboxylesterase